MSKQFMFEDMLPVFTEIIGTGGSFRLYPRGTSMLPTLRQGTDSVMLVAPDEIRLYDIALYRRESGQFVLHRVVGINGERLTMRGDNQLINERGILRSQVIALAEGIYIGDEYAPRGSKGYYYKTGNNFRLAMRRVKSRLHALAGRLTGKK